VKATAAWEGRAVRSRLHIIDAKPWSPFVGSPCLFVKRGMAFAARYSRPSPSTR